MPLILILLLGLFLPRIMLIAGWLLGWFAGAWETMLWPVLGFLLMPYTTLAYGIAETAGGGVQGGWLVLVIVGVLLDLTSGERSLRHRPRRTAT